MAGVGSNDAKSSSSITKYSITFPTKMTGPFFINWGPKDVHKHGHKTISGLITDVKNIKGDGEVGTVRDIRIAQGHHFSHLLIQTDVIDMENHEFRVTLLEGGNIGKKVSAAKYSFKTYKNPGDDNAWLFRVTGWLTPLPEVELTDDDIQLEEEFWMTAVGHCDHYFDNNPDHGYPV